MLLPPLLRGLKGISRAPHQPPTLDGEASKIEMVAASVCKFALFGDANLIHCTMCHPSGHQVITHDGKSTTQI